MAVQFTTLYGAVVEGEQYYSVHIWPLTAAPPIGIFNTLRDDALFADVAARNYDGDLITDLFPSPAVLVGEFVRLVSKRFRFENNKSAPIAIAGLVLIANLDKITGRAVVFVPCPRQLSPGAVLAGRLAITSRIYDEET